MLWLQIAQELGNPSEAVLREIERRIDYYIGVINNEGGYIYENRCCDDETGKIVDPIANYVKLGFNSFDACWKTLGYDQELQDLGSELTNLALMQDAAAVLLLFFPSTQSLGVILAAEALETSLAAKEVSDKIAAKFSEAKKKCGGAECPKGTTPVRIRRN